MDTQETQETMEAKDIQDQEYTPVSAGQLDEVSRKLDRLIVLMEEMTRQQTAQQAAPQPVVQQAPPQPIPQPVQPMQAQPAPQSQPTPQTVQPMQAQPTPPPAPQPVPAQTPGRVALHPYAPQQPQPAMQQAPPQQPQPVMQQAPPQQPQPAMQKPAQQFCQNIPLPQMPVSAFKGSPIAEERKNIEFNIGANVLAVIGVLFVIVALVTFGITMLPSAVQGIFLYVIFMALIAASELFVRKKLERFSVVLTSLGIIGMYASTIVNYMYTKLLNAPMAIGITVLISIAAILLSRKRDSFIMRLILHLGVVACFYPYDGNLSVEFYIVISILVFLINLTAALLPVRHHRLISDHVQAIVLTVFSLLMFLTAAPDDVAFVVAILPLLFSMMITQVLLLTQSEVKKEFVITTSVLHGITLLVLFIELMFDQVRDLEHITAYIGYIALFSLPFVITMIIGLLQKKSFPIREIFTLQCIWLFSAMTALKFEDLYDMLVVIAVYAVATLCYVKKRYTWQHLFFMVTGMFIMLLAEGPSDHGPSYYWMAVAAVVLASLFLVRKYQTIYLSVFTAMASVTFLKNAPYPMPVPSYHHLEVSICALFIALMGSAAWFFKRFRDGYTKFFGYGVTVLTVIAHLALFKDRNWYEFILLLAAGLLVVLYLIQEKHGFKGINRYLVLVIYLTFMIFMIDVDLPIIVSIALMVLSIASVILGFVLKIKSVRVYGLGLALLTCAKIAMYDFAEVGNVSRIAVFLVCGVLAIAISFIYIRLDKRLPKQTAQGDAGNTVQPQPQQPQQPQQLQQGGNL